MRCFSTVAGLFLTVGVLYAQEEGCSQMVAAFEKERQAYERTAAGGTQQKAAADRFVTMGEGVMQRCAHTLTIEERYRLRGELEAAKSARVFRSPMRPGGSSADTWGRQEQPRGVIRTH